jgi:hypothetical protein
MSAYSEWYKNWLIHGFSDSDARYVVQNGFENKEESTISFNAGTRTVTITPVATSYFVWCGGRRGGCEQW